MGVGVAPAIVESTCCLIFSYYKLRDSLLHAKICMKTLSCFLNYAYLPVCICMQNINLTIYKNITNSFILVKVL